MAKTFGACTRRWLLPPARRRLAARALRIAYNLSSAAGASIFTECNMPLRVTGSCAAFFGIQASPPIRAGGGGAAYV